MLQLNMSRALKLPAAREFAIPAPFPGKYPTRIGMMVEWEREGRTGHWRYVGKPNMIAARRFEKEWVGGGLRTLAIMEWDRAWQVSRTTLSWPEPTRREQVTNVGLQVVSPWLWTVYHPWHDLHGAATAWMRQGVWIHKISCALGENTRIYSASPEIGSIYITDYRRRVNVVGQQPTRKKKSAGVDWNRVGQTLRREQEAQAQTPPTQWAWDNPETWGTQTATPAAPVEPAPEPLWRRAARQARAMQQAIEQTTQTPQLRRNIFLTNAEEYVLFGRRR